MITPFEKQLTDLLREIVTEFIAHPEDLEINSRSFHKIISIAWRGHKADTSRMIGGNLPEDRRGAQTYYHLRQLLKLIGEANGYDVDLARVGEPTKGRPERYPDFVARADWPKVRLLAILERAATLAVRHGIEVLESTIAKDTSAVVIRIDQRENPHTETVLRDSLRHLAKAMFSANGRLVKLQAERSLEAEPEQPATSAGRFTK